VVGVSRFVPHRDGQTHLLGEIERGNDGAVGLEKSLRAQQPRIVSLTAGVPMPAGEAGREGAAAAADLFGIASQAERQGLDPAPDPRHKSHQLQWIDRDELVRCSRIVEVAPRTGLEELARVAPGAASIGTTVGPRVGQDSGQLEHAEAFDSPSKILQPLRREGAGVEAGEPEFVIDGKSHYFLPGRVTSPRIGVQC